MGKPGRCYDLSLQSEGSMICSRAEEITRGTESSKYPEEDKAKAIPLVAASERGIAQTVLS
tara:strand:- start:1496 stop:1678 length:183 start_codon:yes stop_codon:yes gene_type:complete